MQVNKHNPHRVQEERTAADVAAYKTLDKSQIARWERCKSAHRFMAFKGKTLVAYKLRGAAPEVLDTFTSSRLSVTLDGGLESSWTDSKGLEITLGSTPTEVAPGCFMWHPKHNTLELVDWKGGKSLRFSVMWRTAFNPSHKANGEIYLSEELAFVKNF